MYTEKQLKMYAISYVVSKVSKIYLTSLHSKWLRGERRHKIKIKIKIKIKLLSEEKILPVEPGPEI